MREILIDSELKGVEVGAKGLSDVVQCVATLLSILEGTVVLDRDLGLTVDLVDRPLNRLSPVYREIYEKFEVYEPRVKIKRIKTMTDNLTGSARIQLLCEVHEEFRR